MYCIFIFIHSCKRRHPISFPFIFILSLSITKLFFSSLSACQYRSILRFVCHCTGYFNTRTLNILHYSELKYFHSEENRKDEIISHLSLVAEWNEKCRSFKIIINNWNLCCKIRLQYHLAGNPVTFGWMASDLCRIKIHVDVDYGW